MRELERQLNAEDEEQRRLAVISLKSYPLSDTKGYLFSSLGDSSWRVRKEAVDALLESGLDEGTMAELVELLRSHENAGLRNSTVELFERLGVRAVPVLCRHVNDSDHDVRKFVMDIMGSIRALDSVPMLMEALNDQDQNVSAAAAENLGKIGDARAVPALVNALAKNDMWFRFTILEALSKIGEPVPLEVIAPLANDNLLKKAVFDSLGALGDEKAVPLLMEGLKEKVRSSRDAAAVALIKIRQRLSADQVERTLDPGLGALKGSPFVDGLLASLDTSDRNLQEALVLILGKIGDERATYKLLQGCRDDRLRRSCMEAFYNLGALGAASLVSLYPDADEQERCIIISVCGKLHYPGSDELFRSGMADPHPLVRRAAVIAAGKAGFPDLILDIVALLGDSDNEVRDGAIGALTMLAPNASETVLKVAQMLASADKPSQRRDATLLFAALHDLDKLALLVKDEDADVRTAAVAALASLRSPLSASHLVLALVDEESDVRIAAANALGEIGGDDVLEPLLLAAKDEDPWVQCAALRGIGKIASESALPSIMEILNGADGLVLMAALEALAGIGGESAFSLVKSALDNSDEEVVKTAIDILSATDADDWILEYEEKLLSHPNWDVRNTFVRAMGAQLGERAVPRLRRALEAETDELVRGQIQDVLGRFQ
jgi:HEAT repeat protein